MPPPQDGRPLAGFRGAFWLVLFLPLIILCTLFFRLKTSCCSSVIVVPSRGWPIKYPGLLPLLRFLFFSSKQKPDSVNWMAAAVDIQRQHGAAKIISFPVFLLHFVFFNKSACLPHLSKGDVLALREGLVSFYCQEVLLNLFSYSRVGWGRLAYEDVLWCFDKLEKIPISSLAGKTKYEQCSIQKDNLEGKIIFIGQIPSDKSIRQCYRFSYISALYNFKRLADRLRLKPVVKIHPLLGGRRRAEFKHECERLGFEFIEDDIRWIVREAKIATVCSGVGIEALSVGNIPYVLGEPSYADYCYRVRFAMDEIYIFEPDLPQSDFFLPFKECAFK